MDWRRAAQAGERAREWVAGGRIRSRRWAALAGVILALVALGAVLSLSGEVGRTFAASTVLLDDGERKYVWGLGLAYAVDGSGTIEVHHTDGLGSVRAITDAAGQVVQTYRTEEFGIAESCSTAGSLGQPFQYTGEPQDATGLVYLRARMYDPQTGRFLQRDPFPGLVTAPQTLHPYSYALNDPSCSR